MCGAPYYHVLLWIEKAPVTGVDPETTSFKMDPRMNYLLYSYQIKMPIQSCITL